MATPPKYSKEEIEEAFAAECPYFYELQNKLQNLDDGIVSLQVKKFNGKLQEWVTTVSIRNKVK